MQEPRWLISLLMATVCHVALLLAMGADWKSDHAIAEDNAAPLVVRLAPAILASMPTNDMEPVEGQKPKRKKAVKKETHLKGVQDTQHQGEAKIQSADRKQFKEDTFEEQSSDTAQDLLQEQSEETTESSTVLAQQSSVAEEDEKHTPAAPIQGHQRELMQQIEMSWQSQVMSHLAQRKRYPHMARKRQQQGTVFVRFSVDQKGNVDDIEVIKKSKFTLLNNEAKAVLHRAAPLPVPPDFILAEQKKIVVPIKFYLM